MKKINYNGFTELVPSTVGNWIRKKKTNIISKSISLGSRDSMKNYEEITEEEAIILIIEGDERS